MVNVIGLGYIGLPTALMMAAHGVETVGTDYNHQLVKTLSEGKLTFKEKGLEELFNQATEKGIRFSTEYQKTEMYVVAVSTPHDEVTKKVDTTYVEAAINNILDVCEKGAVIIIESTVSPGTIDRFIRPIFVQKGFELGKDIHIAHAPERIIPGNMIYELLHNNRTIGVDDVEIGKKVKELYSSFCQGEIIVTDVRTAEMTKVVENTYRDINIAFANELAKICRSDNMDVYEIIRIANMHPRVNILSPGPGVGGHCIPVDPWFLVGDYPELTQLIYKAREINDSMPAFTLDRIKQIMKENNLTDFSRVGFYGITYKENVDDTRDSPTLQMLALMKKDSTYQGVKIYDPMIEKDLFENQLHDFDDFLAAVDLVVVLVGHNEIKNNLSRLEDKVVLDTKNVVPLKGVYKL
jgi:UDP-N-acetyl-D-mannosaminuronic acid dehydrogenase